MAPTDLFERSYKNNLECDNMELSDSDLAILILNEQYFYILKNDILVKLTSLPMICKPNLW